MNGYTLEVHDNTVLLRRQLMLIAGNIGELTSLMLSTIDVMNLRLVSCFESPRRRVVVRCHDVGTNSSKP